MNQNRLDDAKREAKLALLGMLADLAEDEREDFRTEVAEWLRSVAAE